MGHQRDMMSQNVTNWSMLKKFQGFLARFYIVDAIFNEIFNQTVGKMQE